MLDPARRIRIGLRGLGFRDFEKGDVAAIRHLEKDVDMRAIHLHRRDIIIGQGMREFEADGLCIEIDRFPRVTAPIGDVMELLQHVPLPGDIRLSYVPLSYARSEATSIAAHRRPEN